MKKRIKDLAKLLCLYMRFLALHPAFCGLVRKIGYNVFRLNISVY